MPESFTREELQLIIRALECLKKVLLEEAGGFARKRLSRRAESLESVAAESRMKVEQAELAGRLQERLQERLRGRIRGR